MKIRARKIGVNFSVKNKAMYSRDIPLITSYGLRTKRDIRKAEAKVKKYRTIAKQYTVDHEIYQKSLAWLMKKGIVEDSSYNILNLLPTDFLKRRLAYIVQTTYNKTPLEARKLVTDGKVYVGTVCYKRPSHLLDVKQLENLKILDNNGGGKR